MADTDGQDDQIDNGTDNEVTFTPEDAKRLQAEHEKMKQALAKANKEAKERRLALKALEDEGLSVEDALALKKRLEDDEHATATRKGDVDKIREQLQNKFEKEIKDRDAVIAKQKTTIYDFLVSSKASEGLNALGAVKGAAKVIMPHIQKHTQVLEEDGKYVVRVIDEDGDTKFNDDGHEMDITGYLNELKKDDVFQHMFVQTNNSGGGSKTGGGSAKGGGEVKLRKSTATKQQKMDIISKKGYKAWSELPE